MNNAQICDHIGIFSSRYQRMITFYTRVLGFAKEAETVIPQNIIRPVFGVNADCQMARLGAGNVKLEIFTPQGVRLAARKNAACGYNHWGYRVADKEAFCKKLRKKR